MAFDPNRLTQQLAADRNQQTVAPEHLLAALLADGDTVVVDRDGDALAVGRG